MVTAILATGLYSLRALYSKKLITDSFSKYSLLLAMRLYGLFSLILIYIFTKSEFVFIQNIDKRVISIAFMSSIIGMFGLTLMYEVLSKIDMGSFATIKALAPVITIIQSYLFLGERLQLTSYFGVLIVVFSVLIVNLKGKESTNNTKKSIALRDTILMIVAYFLMSLSNIGYKSISTSVSPLEYVIFLSIVSITVFSIYVYFKERTNLKLIFSFNRQLFILGTIATLAMYFLNLSFLYLSPSIVNTILQLEIFVLLAFGFLYFKERDNLLLRFSSALVSFIGVTLIIFV